MSYNNNNETVRSLSLCTLWLLQASRGDLGQERWDYKAAEIELPVIWGLCGKARLNLNSYP